MYLLEMAEFNGSNNEEVLDLNIYLLIHNFESNKVIATLIGDV